MFNNGDNVRIQGEGSEIFTVSQVDESRSRCWVGDENGRGWYCFFSQLIPIDVNNEWDEENDYQSGPEDFE